MTGQERKRASRSLRAFNIDLDRGALSPCPYASVQCSVPSFLSKLIHAIDCAEIDRKDVHGFGRLNVPVYHKARRRGGNSDSGGTEPLVSSEDLASLAVFRLT